MSVSYHVWLCHVLGSGALWEHDYSSSLHTCWPSPVRTQWILMHCMKWKRMMSTQWWWSVDSTIWNFPSRAVSDCVHVLVRPYVYLHPWSIVHCLFGDLWCNFILCLYTHTHTRMYWNLCVHTPVSITLKNPYGYLDAADYPAMVFNLSC